MEEKFRNPIQIGIIVSDLDATIRNFKKILEIEPRAIAEFPPLDSPDVEQYYNGEPGNSKGKFCFFDFGNIEIEVIMPISGKSIWQDFLDTHGPGLHHIKFSVGTHKESKAFMGDIGFSISQMGAAVGRNTGKEWLYYNTYDKLGFDLEVMNEIIE